VETALKNRQKHFVIDGEAVILGLDGISDFNALHSGKHNEEVQLCAFDILMEGGDDLRKLPLSMRKANLERLLARRPEGIFVNPFERREIGPDLTGDSITCIGKSFVPTYRRRIDCLIQMKAVRPVAKQAWATFEHRSARQTSKQTRCSGKSRRGKPWRLLRQSFSNAELLRRLRSRSPAAAC